MSGTSGGPTGPKRGTAVDLLSRALIAQDLPEVGRIAERCFPTAWAPRDFIKFLEHPSVIFLAAQVAGVDGLIGYFIGLLVQGELDVVSLAVDPPFRHLGYGKQIVRRCQSDPRVTKMTLEVDVENIAAIALYRQTGFTVASVRKKYYEQQRDAYLMVWVK